jgi:HAD superfamily hydrolase (TIGR01509 family)
MHAFQAIIFDMDGVLIDSEVLWDRKETACFQTLVPEFSQKDQENILGGSWQTTYDYIKKIFHISFSKEEFREKYIQFGIENIYKKTNLTQGVRYFLETAKEKNIPTALASSSCYPWIDTVLDRLDVRKYFDVIVSADDLEGKGKPHPDIFLKTAQLLDKDPKKCLVLEDSTNGIIAGKCAGMTVYAFQNGVNDHQDLGRADRAFDSFRDLAKNI